MKIKCLAYLFFAISFWACSPEKEETLPAPAPETASPAAALTCKKWYTYDQLNQQTYHLRSDSTVFVGFNTRNGAETAAVLAAFEFLKPVDTAISNNLTMFFVRFKTAPSCPDFDTRLATILQHPGIAFANPVFNYERWSFATEFVVKLKNSTDLALLQQLAATHQCQVVEALDQDIYLLTVTKATGKDAQETANLFHETGSFAWAEANTYYFNIFPGKMAAVAGSRFKVPVRTAGQGKRQG